MFKHGITDFNDIKGDLVLIFALDFQVQVGNSFWEFMEREYFEGWVIFMYNFFDSFKV